MIPGVNLDGIGKLNSKTLYSREMFHNVQYAIELFAPDPQRKDSEHTSFNQE
jgi:hypothetical protein